MAQYLMLMKSVQLVEVTYCWHMCDDAYALESALGFQDGCKALQTAEAL